MPELVLHIPHASRAIPADLRSQIALDDPELERELLRMTDHFTGEVFDASALGASAVVYPVSRLVTDPERFPDDAEEPMAARGMGAIYTRTSDGRALRSPPTPEARRSLMDRFYWPHHRRLTEAVDRELERAGHCLVLDCHSFPAKPLPYELDQRTDRPEICLGTDAFHTPAELRESAERSFASAGFGVAIDRPFPGALVPLKHFQRDARVSALMVEVRRDLYIDETTGVRHAGFDSLKERLTRAVLGTVGEWQSG